MSILIIVAIIWVILGIINVFFMTKDLDEITIGLFFMAFLASPIVFFCCSMDKGNRVVWRKKK